MKRRTKKPEQPARCATCGGEKRPADDWNEHERADPRCWLCRMNAAGTTNGAPHNGR